MTDPGETLIGRRRLMVITGLVIGGHAILVAAPWQVDAVARRPDRVLSASLLSTPQDLPPGHAPTTPAAVGPQSWARANSRNHIPMRDNTVAAESPAALPMNSDQSASDSPSRAPSFSPAATPATTAPEGPATRSLAPLQTFGANTSTSAPKRPAPVQDPQALVVATNTQESAQNSRLELPSTNADYQHNAKAAYPPLSRRLGEQGQVVVRILIGSDGVAQKSEIQQSSGFSRLDQAALTAVMRWRYLPGRRSGVPETMWFTAPITFTLE